MNRRGWKQTVSIACIAIGAIAFGVSLGLRGGGLKSQQVIIDPRLPMLTVKELASFDGTDPKKPVYIAMDSHVYDVSAGRNEFYNPGKPYHYLAGRDATIELHIAGGDIIKRKYSIIATLVK